jgi:hypothetical protein
MIRKTALLALLFATITVSAYSAMRNPKDSIKSNTLYIGPFFSIGSTLTSIDSAGDEQSKIQEKFPGNDTTFEYGFEQMNYTFGLEAEYYLTPEISLSSRMSFIYHDYTERYSDNDASSKAGTIRYTKSFTKPLSLDFGGRYKALHFQESLFDNTVDMYLLANAKILFMDNSAEYNPLIPQLYDKSRYQGGVQFDYLAKTYFFSTSLLYNHRDLAPSDQGIFRAEAGLKKVEDSRVFVFFETAFNLKNGVNDLVFDPRQMPGNESHGTVGAELSLILGRGYYCGVSYATTIYGKNTLSGGNGFFRLGVIF